MYFAPKILNFITSHKSCTHASAVAIPKALPAPPRRLVQTIFPWRGNFPASGKTSGKPREEISPPVAEKFKGKFPKMWVPQGWGGGGVIKRLQTGRSCKINVCKLRPSMSAGEPLFVDILKVLWSLRFESAFLAFRACLFCTFRISADFFFSLECSLISKIFVVRREKSFFLQLVWSG